MSVCDVSVEASVGQLRLVFLALFVSKLTQFLKELELSQAAIDRAKRSAQESATAAMTAVSTPTPHIHTTPTPHPHTIHPLHTLTLHTLTPHPPYTLISYPLPTHAQVKEQRTTGQRLQLKVTLIAPEVVIPLHSSSDEVIVANLGVLELSNSFHIVSNWPGDERPPLYEEYDIQLKDMRVYRYTVKLYNYNNRLIKSVN